MASIYNLPTILVEPRSTSSFTEIDSKIEEVPLPKPRSRLSAVARFLWRFLWRFLCVCYAYLTFLGDIPLEVLLLNVLTAPGSATKDMCLTVEEERESNDKPVHRMGQLALHPNLPLLAVSTRSSTEICLYNTVNSQQICRFEVMTSKRDPQDEKSEGTLITCLQFSPGDVLAVGLRDGTARIIQQNLRALVKSWPGSSGSCHQPEIQEVNFLPGHSSGISARFLGPVTNLVFSPASRNDLGISAWLAVTTEHSGLWLWNSRTKRTYGSLCPGGVNHGNLHWVCLSREIDTKSQPSTHRATTPAPAEKIALGQSTIQRFENVLGNAQDMLTLNECFAPASMKRALPQETSSSSSDPRRPPLADVANTGDLDGQTVLVMAMKSGQIRVQKLWHSSMMIEMDTFVDFPLRHLANSQPRPLRYHTAGVEISHCAVRPISLARNTAIVPILVAFTRETSSKLHEVVVHLPLKQHVPWSHQACDEAKAILRQVVNLTLRCMCINYEWLPDIFGPPIDDSVLAVNYLGARSVHPSPSSSSSRASLVSLSMIPHQYPATGALLATLRPALSEPTGNSQLNSCVLLSPGNPEISPSALDQLARIIPQIPNPFLPTPKPLPLGYYSRMWAGIDQSEDRHQIPYARTESLVEHDYTCGQARWGMSRNGRILGAFLYQPASLLDPGVGVALFEVKLDEN